MKTRERKRERGNETNEAGVIMMTVIAIIVRSIMSSRRGFSRPFGAFSLSWWNLPEPICFDFPIMMSPGDMFAVTCCFTSLIIFSMDSHNAEPSS